MASSIYDEPDMGLAFPLPLSEEEDRIPATCPGCGFVVSQMEILTGVCAKDGQPLSQPRVIVEVTL